VHNRDRQFHASTGGPHRLEITYSDTFATSSRSKIKKWP
jgi:hypothetical protein